MQRVSVTVRLNGISLQFDQAAYVRLEAYLQESEESLKGNPDRAEIIGDLEQAVADQCLRRMGPGQQVVTLNELQPAIDEIGPVQEAEIAAPPPATTPRRLEQVSEGALISGVCQGVARYFSVDVTLVRVIALLLLIFSGGVMILVYAILMLLLPFAEPTRGGAPVGKIPRKSREIVGMVRSKLSAATS